MNAINTIPVGWVETTMGEIAEIGSSKRIFFSDYVSEGVPFYRSKEVIEKQKGNDISIELFITNDKFQEIESKFGSPQKDDLLLTSVGTLGIPYLVRENEKFYFKDGNLTWFKNYKSIVPNFLYYWLLSSIGKNSLKKITIGSTQSALTIAGLRTIPIIIPGPNEQQSITAILTAYDDKIELLRAQNKILEVTTQTIFKEWFSKHQIGDELPDGWRVGKIEEFIGELETGTRPKGGVGAITEGVPSVGAESIGGITNFEYSKTKYVPVEFFNKMNRGIVKDYDILIYKDGGLPGTFIPKFSMFGEGFPFSTFCINEHVFRLQPKKAFQRFYLYNWLNSRYCKKQLQNIGGKAAIPGINSTDLKYLDIIIPDENKIKSYDCCVKPFYKKILTNMVQIQTMSITRDTLLPKLMSGEIRVKMEVRTI